MDLGINGKRAAVAASSAGLGLGVARALAAAGCSVVTNGRDAERLHDATESVPGGIPIAGDVGTIEGATAFVDAATEALGGIDILVTNAGGPPAGTFATTPTEAYPAALELNLLSAVAMCEGVVPAMRARGWGRIVAITSISVRQPIAHLILSNTARAGLTGFLKTLATEVAGDGVTVNSVQPGLHATDRLRSLGSDLDALARTVPTGTVGDPDDFGRVAAFLCSESARFITGAAIPVDGGSYSGLL
ncbi:SDR family oxidoreductase [Actinospongicola halichondriae]|uniref:SDR family oxidoreductase n=1 Tax=Actinospongicola halichondriae TaxID=3236844 RepID=UPI003D415387